MIVEAINPMEHVNVQVTRPGIALYAGSFFAARAMLVLLAVRLDGMYAEVGVILSLVLNYLLLLVTLLSTRASKSRRDLVSATSICVVALYLFVTGLSWAVATSKTAAGFQARHVHNEWLQQFYAYGALGVALTVAIYVSIVRSVRSLRGSRIKQVFIGLFFLVLVRGLADTETFDLSWSMWLLVLVGALQLQDMTVDEEIPCAL